MKQRFVPGGGFLIFLAIVVLLAAAQRATAKPSAESAVASSGCRLELEAGGGTETAAPLPVPTAVSLAAAVPKTEEGSKPTPSHCPFERADEPAVTPAPTLSSTPVERSSATPEPSGAANGEPALEFSQDAAPTTNTDRSENGWQPEKVVHDHGTGTNAGVCPACGLIYGPAGGEEGQYGEQDGMMD